MERCARTGYGRPVRRLLDWLGDPGAPARAVVALAVAALAGGCATDEAGRPATETDAAGAPGRTAPATAARRPAAPPADLRGVSSRDTRWIRGHRGWTPLRGRPDPALAALGSAHRGGAKRIAVDQPASRIAPGGRQRFPYPVGTTVVKTAGPVAAPTLVAIMRKVARGGAAGEGWVYVEYLRASPSAPLARVAAPEALCADCHLAASRDQGTDRVFSTLR